MPIYEYRCEKCSRVFEVLQKFSDAPLTAHEECGGAVERLISASGLQFKGSGWYVTDYARGSKGSKEGGESKDAAGAEKKSDTADSKPATETKPSASTESKPAASSVKSD